MAFTNKGPRDVKISPPFLETVEGLRRLIAEARNSPLRREMFREAPEFSRFVSENKALRKRLDDWQKPAYAALHETFVELACAVSALRTDVQDLRIVNDATGGELGSLITQLEDEIELTERTAGIRPSVDKRVH